MRVKGYPGYVLDLDPDAPRLFAPNGRPIAVFGGGWTTEATEEAAKEHAECVDVSTGRLERLLKEREGA